MSAPPIIADLVERFERNSESYYKSGYNETELRREYLDPFFKALGWDVDNEGGLAERYKDVVHEDSIKVSGEAASKAPDYCFRVGGTRKFFVEAKRPQFTVDDKEAAFQIRRYAFSAKLPLSILTNFREFFIYDCHYRPAKTDNPQKGCIKRYTYRQYPNAWPEIANVFSRDAILKGEFDKFAETAKGKKGTAEVDSEILKDIDGWRESLARNLALRNPALTVEELNFSVGRLIDRIVFLRVCEDRGIEADEQIKALLRGKDIYKRLSDLFQRADERYNSGLFHFHNETNRAEPPDKLTLRLKVDDKPLKDLIQSLYYPDSPYVFSQIPADILGQVYEQFLGKVIRLTPRHEAVVEDKPEVKKAGGVYYTPTYIVDYIVKQTVGKLFEGKTPREVAKLRILDPACGSGSFLLGAYQHLLNWYLDQYLNDGVAKHRKELAPGLRGDWRLDAKERKRILLAHIYGVDLDAQAVEVTKLSLLLKVLEGETQLEANVRALPDLGSNIKCGNSLIGTDFYEEHPDLSDEERRRINPFDWKTEFKTIFKDGGFDAVIGNPPYGFHQIHTQIVKDYFKGHLAASVGSFEHYFLFYEATLKLLAPGGLHGFIVPVTWLTIPSASGLRHFILQNYAVRSIAWLPELVFKNAQVNTLVSVIARAQPGATRVLISEVNDPSLGRGISREYEQAKFVAANHTLRIFEDDTESELIERIVAQCQKFGDFVRPCSGYNPYEVGKGVAPSGQTHTKRTVIEKPYHSEECLGPDWKPEVGGRELGRYSIHVSGKRFVKYGAWLAAPRDPNNFLGPRLLVQEITGGKDHRIVASYCEEELYHSRDIIPVKCDKSSENPLFLLGLLNSLFMSWWHHRRNPKSKKALFPKLLVGDLVDLPVPRMADKKGKARHEKMVSLVERMLKLNRDVTEARTDVEQERIKRQIAATDKQIDNLVYELYGLTAEEIGIVEGGEKKILKR